jgi:hypothetical protein
MTATPPLLLLAQGHKPRPRRAPAIRPKEITPHAMSVENERAVIRNEWPAEFDDKSGGYPRGFHGWPLARRNAWFAGFNKGLVDSAKND